MNRLDLLMNPVRVSIMQYLTLHKMATASEIINNLKNVSRATVYNHIKILEENELICVVQENQVRGTVEKIYSLKKKEGEPPSDYTSIINYLLYLMVDFQNYFENPQNDMKKDMFFADRSVIYLEDKDFKEFFKEYTKLCEKYYHCQYKENKKGRTISLISSPFVNGDGK